MESRNFLEEIIEADLAAGTHGGRLLTRFPPEPNGYLHVGHAKSICVNFGLAEQYGGVTNLRFDDTNPTTEDTEYVQSIMRDVAWLGFQWAGEVRYASDYFPELHRIAVSLIERGLAYVDFSTSEEMAAQKGSPTLPGTPSTYRDQPPAWHLAEFAKMTEGAYPDGHCVLRARIDLASPNMHLRDPVLYRIKHEAHHRTGTQWCIYPMYDFAHPLSDAIEGITHSLCTLEFEVHRPLYDWLIAHSGLHVSRQYEFARLNLSYTIMSKRKLLRLVNEGQVSGWDDPRMPTISGMRRRGYTPESVREFATRVGVAKRENVIEVSLLEFCVREHLNKIATRVMVVLDPLRVVLTNYPEGQTEELPTENNPEDPQAGTRMLPFGRSLWIEREDFMEQPPKGYFRLSPGGMVRLKSGYIIRCDEAVKDAEGQVVELRCTYAETSRSGSDTSGLNVKGTIHWVAAHTATPIEVRLYDRLFTAEDPEADPERPFTDFLNPNALRALTGCMAEPAVAQANATTRYQFLRKGYFCLDPDTEAAGHPVFNLTVGLKDAWAKAKK